MVVRRIYPVDDCINTILSLPVNPGEDMYILDAEFITDILMAHCSGINTVSLNQAYEIASSYGVPYDVFDFKINTLMRQHGPTLTHFLNRNYNPDTDNLRMSVTGKELFLVITKKPDTKPSELSLLKQSLSNWDYVPEKFRLLLESYPDE